MCRTIDVHSRDCSLFAHHLQLESASAPLFFNTADEHRDCDEEGVELSNGNAARAEAIRYAGAVLNDHPDILWDGRDFRVEVVNEDKQLVCTVITLAVDMPEIC